MLIGVAGVLLIEMCHELREESIQESARDSSMRDGMSSSPSRL
jgi:hypothetical protein